MSKQFNNILVQLVLSTDNEVKIAIRAMNRMQLDQDKIVYYLLDVSNNS